MNVQSPHWANLFAKAGNPVTCVLAGAFTLPRDVPDAIDGLLKRLERPRRMR